MAAHFDVLGGAIVWTRALLMVALSVKAFRGEVPRTNSRLIGDNQAQRAQNCKITAGILDPLYAPSIIHKSILGSMIKTLYHYKHIDNVIWMVWPNVVDVVRSPIAQDARGRLYYTGDGTPKMTTYLDCINNSSGPYPARAFTLGVVAPKNAPTVAVSGGAAPAESRVYVWTWKNQYAEESAPSPAKIVSGNVNGTWTVSGFDNSPLNTASITAVSGGAGVASIATRSTYGLSAGDEISITGTNGMDKLNGTCKILSVPDESHFNIKSDASGAIGAGGSWSLVAGHNLSGMVRCIYRTNGTNSTFRLVAEIPATQTSYTDIKQTSELNINLATLETELPPKNLHSLIGLPNGALAGLAGNELCFSEPYKPHSWPVAYRYSFPSNGVALSAIGNSVIVLTDSFPYLATATVPEAVSMSQIETYAPCVSKSGVVDIGEGCIFPSHDGLYLAQAGPVRNLTSALFRRDEWDKLWPSTFYATFHDQKYYARHMNVGSEDDIFVLDVSEPDSVLRINYQPSAMYASNIDGLLYVANGTDILSWDSNYGKPYLAYWESKEFSLNYPMNFGAAQVYADFDKNNILNNVTTSLNNKILLSNANNPDGALAADALNTRLINGSKIRPLKNISDRKVVFSLIKEGKVFFNTEVIDSRPFRLPSGYKADNITVSITSNIPVYSFAIAEVMAELRGIN